MCRTSKPLLRQWLKDNGVKYTSKDSKDALVAMATDHIKKNRTAFKI